MRALLDRSPLLRGHMTTRRCAIMCRFALAVAFLPDTWPGPLPDGLALCIRANANHRRSMSRPSVTLNQPFLCMTSRRDPKERTVSQCCQTVQTAHSSSQYCAVARIDGIDSMV